MFELYCLMCGHTWTDPRQDKCPECGCRDFLVNDDSQDQYDGHFEGDFASNSGYTDLGE